MRLNDTKSIDLISITGVPGSGKSSLCGELYRRGLSSGMVPCYTTRKRRTSDLNQSEYVFVTENEFLSREALFFSVTKLHGDFYGTLLSDLETCIGALKPWTIIASLDLALRLRSFHSLSTRFVFLGCPLPVIRSRISARDGIASTINSRLDSCLDWPEIAEKLRETGEIPFVHHDSSINLPLLASQVHESLAIKAPDSTRL